MSGTLKSCTVCKQTKPIEEFGRRGGQTRFAHHVKSRCKLCERDQAREYKRKKALEDPLASRKYWLNYKYGLSLEDYGTMLLEQNGVCAICEQPETYIDVRSGKIRPLVVDHCHTTGRVRGLLCNNCNAALGQVQDNKDTILKAIVYLQRKRPLNMSVDDQLRNYAVGNLFATSIAEVLHMELLEPVTNINDRPLVKITYNYGGSEVTHVDAIWLKDPIDY